MRNSTEKFQPTSLQKKLWSACGADVNILAKATYAERVKYACMGGIVFATGFMACLAGGYAFYTIFSEKGANALDEVGYDYPVMFISILFGIAWGLMIFNLDRFIVSSTGKGDGTDKITMLELRNALPRILLGIIIAITIAKPLEIRMFKTEIDVELERIQTEKAGESRAAIDANFEDEITRLTDLNTQYGKELKDLEKRYLDEGQGKGSRFGDGFGPIAAKIKIQLDNTEKLFLDNKEKLDNQIDLRDKEYEKADKAVESLDGLLARIQAIHAIEHNDEGERESYVSLFITLLFVAIELTPILFKLMHITSTYDYLKDNESELSLAYAGVYIQKNYHKDKVGQERDLVRHLKAESVLSEEKELLAVQERLTKHALKVYEEKMVRDINNDPESYVRDGFTPVKRDNNDSDDNNTIDNSEQHDAKDDLGQDD